MPPRFLFVLAMAGAFLAFRPVGAQDPSSSQAPASIEAGFQAFWAAPSPVEAELRAEDILKSGVTFDEAWQRLKKGRTYTAQQSGVILRTNRGKDTTEYHYHVNIPASYDPARRYQVRFHLHGGAMGRPDNQPRGTGEIPLPGAEQIYVLPYSWKDAPWWSDRQVLNLAGILDALKRTYNVDENRVVVSGSSDGATGTYYIGMRETTRFASFLPLNGFIMVLSSSTSIDDGGMFPNNLRNKPIFVVNGGRDRLYPTVNVEPFVKHLMEQGVNTAYHPQPDGEHNTAWWPELKDTFEQFVAAHARDPHPASLTWETRNLSLNLAHWLVIDQLGAAQGEAASMPDINEVAESDPIPAQMIGSDGTTTTSNYTGKLFRRLGSRTSRYGRVDIVQKGNTIQATTKGVTGFTLLLSPDRFDFGKPITVTANGQIVFDGHVERSLPALMKWAARDNDRTMLYAAELKVTLPRLRPVPPPAAQAN